MFAEIKILKWAFLSILFIIFTGYVIIIFNSLVRLKNNIKKSWANIDVLLKQRNDELPNLVNAVKGYMKHEKGVLAELTNARTSILNAQTLSQKARADSAITKALKTIFAVAENYPTLRANENFLQLQSRISGLENEIADRREFYNDSVTNYNTRIQSFPDLLLAKTLSYAEETLFEALGNEKKKVEINME